MCAGIFRKLVKPMIHPLVQAIFSAGGGAAPQPSCSVTLTGDIAAVFGGQPLDISGQVVSKTVPASPANAYIAGAASTISGWSGWRAVGYQASDFTTAGNSEHTLIVINATYTTYVGLLYSEAWSGWIILVNGGVVGTISGGATSKAGVRVDGASGDVEISVDGVVRTKATHASFGSLFSGAAILPVPILGSLSSSTLTEGDTYAAQVYTAAEDLADVGFPAGTLDWCENVIPDGPYAYRLNASEAFITASAPGTEKMVPSADEQTGTTTLAFTGSSRRAALVGNLETESPLATNYLNDMSYGTGDFVCELHIDWPELTGSSVTGTIGAFNQLIDGGSGVFIQLGSLMGAVVSSNIITARIWDDEGVKKYSVWKDGTVLYDGLVIGVDFAVGINLSQLFVIMYTEEGGDTVGTEAEFVDPSPQIITRLVTDPAEMVHAQTVLPRTAQTIVGNGQVVIP